MLLTEAVEVNTVAQGALRRFTQCQCVKKALISKQTLGHFNLAHWI